jgi:hypothetical protein
MTTPRLKNIGPLNDRGYLRIAHDFLHAAQGELPELSPAISHVLTAIDKELDRNPAPPYKIMRGKFLDLGGG